MPQISATLDSVWIAHWGKTYSIAYTYNIENLGRTPTYDLRSGSMMHPQKDLHLPDSLAALSGFASAEVSAPIYPNQKFAYGLRTGGGGNLSERNRSADTAYIAIYYRFTDQLGNRHFCLFDHHVIVRREVRENGMVLFNPRTSSEWATCKILNFGADTVTMRLWNEIIDSLQPVGWAQPTISG